MRPAATLWLLPLLLWGAVAPAAEEALAVAQPAYREVTLTGFTRARASLPLVAESGGTVLTVTADIGDTIAEPGTFARIDPTFIELDLEANRVQQRQLRSRVEYDSREAARYRELRQKGSTSASSLDQLEQTLRDNRLRLEELAVQERVLEERLTRTHVQAPVGWRVTARAVEPGQRVSQGQVLGEVGDFSALLAPFALTPEQFAALRRQEASLRLSLPDWGLEVPAQVYRVSPGFDAATRKVDLDLALGEGLPERRGGLRVSLAIKIVIDLQHGKERIDKS